MARDEVGTQQQGGIAPCAVCGPIASRAPYGYQRRGKGNRVRLEPDPLTAPVVRRIFKEYLGGKGLQLIANGLTADGVLRPSEYDPQRNPHHSGSGWSKAAVRAIITNDRYARNATLRECENGGACDRRCASRRPGPLVSAEVYRQIQDILAERGAGSGRSAEPPTCQYVLRGLLRCELCQRLMQGSWNNNAVYYRCRFPREFARANNIDHPANVYVREDRLLETLLSWVYRSLPVRLRDWAAQQSPVVRTRLTTRVQGLRELLNDAQRGRTRYAEVYSAMGMRLVYDPRSKVVQVRTEILPGAVVTVSFEL